MKTQYLQCPFSVTFSLIKQHANQIFYYTRCITLKRVTSLRDPSLRYCALYVTQLLSKCRRSGEPLAALCPI